MILNIETSAKICSVSLSHELETVFSKRSEGEMEHSAKLAPFVEEAMIYMTQRDLILQGIAVSLGPGSYTGLRIGLSLAKGLVFSRNLPLIGVPTLEILATKALFSFMQWKGDELFVPLIDARRMEVYTAVYDNSLNEVMKPCSMILDETSYKEYDSRKLIFIGDAVGKAQKVLNGLNAEWIESFPLATDMNALSEKFLRERRFMDVAYSTPIYIKNFQPTTPKKIVESLKNC